MPSFRVLLCDYKVAPSQFFYTFFLPKRTGNIRFSFLFWEMSVKDPKKWTEHFLPHLVVELEVLNLEIDGRKNSKKEV